MIQCGTRASWRFLGDVHHLPGLRARQITLRWRQRTHNELEKGRLSCTIGANQGHFFTPNNLHIDVVQQLVTSARQLNIGASNHLVTSLSQKVTPEHIAFWQFSGQIYAAAGVAEPLLAAQEQWHIWINDWLFALWQAQQQRVLRPTFNHQLRQQYQWRQQVVVRWRKQRQTAKAEHPQRYHGLLAAELALEWCDQMTLAQRARQLTQPTAAQSPLECLQISLHALSAPTPRAAQTLAPVLSNGLDNLIKRAHARASTHR